MMNGSCETLAQATQGRLLGSRREVKFFPKCCRWRISDGIKSSLKDW